MAFESRTLASAVRSAVIILFAVVFAACSQDSSDSPSITEPGQTSNNKPAPKVQQGTEKPYSIGDITYGFYAIVTMNRKTLPESISYEEEVSQRFDSRVTMVKARIFEPIPEEIPIYVRVGSVREFPGDAVLVTAKLFIDEKEVDSFDYLFGEKRPIQDTRLKEIDLRSHLEDSLESVLVRVDLVATLYKNTEAASIDMDTVERPEKDTVTVYSNPMRIEFVR